MISRYRMYCWLVINYNILLSVCEFVDNLIGQGGGKNNLNFETLNSVREIFGARLTPPRCPATTLLKPTLT